MPGSPIKKRKPEHGNRKSNSGKKKKKRNSTGKGQTTVTNDGQMKRK